MDDNSLSFTLGDDKGVVLTPFGRAYIFTYEGADGAQREKRFVRNPDKLKRYVHFIMKSAKGASRPKNIERSEKND